MFIYMLCKYYKFVYHNVGYIVKIETNVEIWPIITYK